MTDTDAKLRCELTGHPVGTDTRGNGYTCPCPACQTYLRLSAVIAERDAWFAEAEDRANSCSLLIRERDALRQIISDVATAAHAGVAPTASLDFMRLVPGEVAAVVGRAQADLDEMRKALEAAGYYIERLRTAYSGKPVRDLDEAGVAYDSLSAALKQGETP